MNTWDSILIAVVTAVVTIGLSEGIRFFRDRAADRNREADFTITPSPVMANIGRGAFSYIANVGDGIAHNVDFTLTGDSEFEIHPDARLDVCRPGDGFLVYVLNVGTGIARITWTDARGRTQSRDRIPKP